jgi:hypothetical protein
MSDIDRPRSWLPVNLCRAAARRLSTHSQLKLSAEIYRGVWEDVGTPERLRALNLDSR